MNKYMICPICNTNQVQQRHHRFKQSKINIKTYGRKLIDANFNILMVCASCHVSHAKIPPSEIWSETYFRMKLKELNIKPPDPTKSYRLKMINRDEFK